MISHCRWTCLLLATNAFCDIFGTRDENVLHWRWTLKCWRLTRWKRAFELQPHRHGNQRSRDYYYHYQAYLPTLLERSSGSSNIKLNWYGQQYIIKRKSVSCSPMVPATAVVWGSASQWYSQTVLNSQFTPREKGVWLHSLYYDNITHCEYLCVWLHSLHCDMSHAVNIVDLAKTLYNSCCRHHRRAGHSLCLDIWMVLKPVFPAQIHI